ncbi:MAG: hypothetical protein ACPGU7_01160 [Gammaproteobacteria bacterium]
MTKKSTIDDYARKAQLFPALLVVLPILLIVLVLVPDFATRTEGLSSLIVGLAVMVWMANISRQAGQRAQSRLFPLGLPGKEWLRHRDETLEAPTKARYKLFLSEQIPGIVFPATEDERADPDNADAVYSSAIRWLVDNTRDNARVRQELIDYGFRRNLFGLRRWGIVVSLVTAGVTGGYVWWRYGVAAFAEAPALVSVGIVSAVILPALWIGSVTQEWVSSAAKSYARALLGVCDLRHNGT